MKLNNEDLSGNYADIAAAIRNLSFVGGLACMSIVHQMDYAPTTIQKMFVVLSITQFAIAAQAEIGWLAATL